MSATGGATVSVTDMIASVVGLVFFGVQGVLYRQSVALARSVRRVEGECASFRQLLVGVNGDNGLHGDVRRLRDEFTTHGDERARERQDAAVWRRGVDDTLGEHTQRLGMLERRSGVERRRNGERRSKVR